MSVNAQWTTTKTPSQYTNNQVEVGSTPHFPAAWINTYSDNCVGVPISPDINSPVMTMPTNHILMRQFGYQDGEYNIFRYKNPDVDCKLQTDYIFKTDLIYSRLILDGHDHNGVQNRYLTFWEQHMEVHQPTFFYNNISSHSDINTSATITSQNLNTTNATIGNATISNLTVNNQPIFNNGIKIKNSALQITDANNNIVWNFRPDGKLGVGVATSEMVGPYWMWVKNGIMTERIKVAVKGTLDWADYVFDKSYKLKSLAEVEEYINKNKHLPEIPSAEEVVKNGVDVQTMDAKLLQKIEELTLYVINLKKEIDLLKTKKQK